MRESNAEIQELKKASGVSQNVSHQVSLLASKVSCTLVYSTSILYFPFPRLTELPDAFQYFSASIQGAGAESIFNISSESV